MYVYTCGVEHICTNGYAHIAYWLCRYYYMDAPPGH